MQPQIGNGFGCFGRILGPWSDFFPSSGGFGLPTSQFGVALGTTIVGGAKGATLASITVDAPFNNVGSSTFMLWRLTVVKGPIPPDLTRLGNKWQHAVNGYPFTGEQDQDSTVLFSKIIGATNSPNSGSASQVQAFEYLFPDMTGPSVGPGELMTVFITPLFNETGVPGFGANNSTYTCLTVNGVYDRRIAGSDDKDQTARSIPRGRVGGM